LIGVLGRPSPGKEPPTGRAGISLTPRHIAFLKIAEGCSRRCTFCSIPSIRGPYRSRDAGEIVEEAVRLESAGVRELTVVSQDTVSYIDGRGRGLVELVEALLRRTSIPWIRLLYLNPGAFPEGLIDLLAGERRLLGYVDLPIQHIATPVLRRMGRSTGRGDIERLIDTLRGRVDGLVLRTTVLVGFPGEREEDFEELMEFVERVKFERLGGFAYSCEEGTPASRLPGQVPGEVKQDRLDRLMELQRSISREHCRDRLGETVTVLVDGETSPDEPVSELLDGVVPAGPVGWVGRSRCEAYEVDGSIYLSGAFGAGEFAEVEIVGAGDYDLVARRLPPEAAATGGR
jgi:ribosomal protein S12 methylthiotransferase